MIHLWAFVGTICLGFMPPQGETNCHKSVGWQRFASQVECETENAKRDPRVIHLKCAEVIDK